MEAVGVVQRMENVEPRMVIAVLILLILLIHLGPTNAMMEKQNATQENTHAVVQAKVIACVVAVDLSVAQQARINGVVNQMVFAEALMAAVEQTELHVMMV